MADPNEAGTPPTETPGSESAGTGVQAADGSESSGKPVDPALAMAWKAKAEEGNRALQRVADLEARLASIQQVQYAQQVQADPMSQMVQGLRERAQYGDADAASQLAILTMTAQQAAETNLTNEMVKAGVPADKWDVVSGLVRQSGYRTPVAMALQLARGSEVPDLAKQLDAERQRNAALEKALNSRTVGGSQGGNPTATTPAAVSAGGTMEVSPDEYVKLSPDERARAKIRY